MKFNGKNIRHSTMISTAGNEREGQPIEKVLAQMKASKQVIDLETAPEIFQERSAGVDPMCDIRTDKMQLAQDARDVISRTHMLARANREDMGKKKQEDYTWVTDSDGNIVKNPTLETESK